MICTSHRLRIGMAVVYPSSPIDGNGWNIANLWTGQNGVREIDIVARPQYRHLDGGCETASGDCRPSDHGQVTWNAVVWGNFADRGHFCAGLAHVGATFDLICRG